MKVGIAGSFSAINRHVCVLEKISDIAIAGKWSVNGRPDSAVELDSGRVLHPEQVVEQTDAVIITDRGEFYRRLATLALRSAKHVFLYTPLVGSVNEAYQLIKLGNEANVILKCGRTGTNGIKGLINHIPDLKQISMVEFRHSISINHEKPFHLQEIILADMEIISRLIHARNTSVKAKGICMLSSKPEVVNARLEFDNGTAVNYYCNIASSVNEHDITLVLKERLLNFNLLTHEVSGWRKKHTDTSAGAPEFFEKIRVEMGDHLFDDLSSFFSVIKSGPAFLTIYDNGFESFILTDKILEKVSKTLVQFV